MFQTHKVISLRIGILHFIDSAYSFAVQLFSEVNTPCAVDIECVRWIFETIRFVVDRHWTNSVKCVFIIREDILDGSLEFIVLHV